MTLASSLAKTPSPPYYAVIVTSQRTEEDRGYGHMADRMVTLASRMPGFSALNLFAAQLDLELPFPIGSQKMRFENGRHTRNIKLHKELARECGTQTTSSELPRSSVHTGKLLVRLTSSHCLHDNRSQ
jgi:hypothetical protein